MHTINNGGGFEWSEEKARHNIRKHGVDFADAVAVFEDEKALTMQDLITAVDEQRFLTMGSDAFGRVLVVAYTWRDERVRIFSARVAVPRERRMYQGTRR